MTWDRVAIVEQLLDQRISTAEPPATRRKADEPVRDGSDLTVAAALGLLEDQLASRQLDVAARELKKTNRSFYTIGSAGHENNAVVGARSRIDDPAFLHYRSGGFFMARARKLAGSTPVMDTMLGVVASAEDPIAQGRHKVWGSRAMWIPPQTSTIASHLPKAMGLAFSLARARRVGVATELPDDAIVVCSFGDASANHATALSAINTARYAVRMGLPMPLLLVCEDNDTGISVPTPSGWIAETYGNQPHLRYVLADGEFDAVVAMYHDQGLIPFKTLASGEGVNFTAGISGVRTSPDHGVAFDIAGKNIADNSSFLLAIYECIDIINRRNDYADNRSNPLRKMTATVMGNAKDEAIEE